MTISAFIRSVAFITAAAFGCCSVSLPATAQTKLDGGDIIQSLYDVENVAEVSPSLARLLKATKSSVVSPGDISTVAGELSNHRQFTLEVNFDFNSSIIKPNSCRAIGAIADAMHHPYLEGYSFLIVGHTDAKGSREYNLRLSQERAVAIRDALVTTFKVAPNRLWAMGVGEELLKSEGNPNSELNRRVQLINIGKMAR